jgi:ribosome biogenesis protein Tsr3
MDDNYKWGFVDKTGVLVIPCKWKNVWSFHEGLAAVKDDNGMIGFIDKTGIVVLPCKWSAAEDFKNGKAKVYDSSGEHMINKQGQIVK